MNSEIVFLFMYDAGTVFKEEQLNGLLKNREDFSKYEYTKPGPEEIAIFNVPTIFNLKDESMSVGDEEITFKVQVAIYSFGGFSIRVRHAFSGSYELLSRLTFDKRVKDFITGVVVRSKRRVISSLEKIAPIKESALSETYRFYYIEGDKQNMMKGRKKLIAGLMIDEEDEATLEDSYVETVLSKNIAYDRSNVLFVGWESAVMIDKEYIHEHELLMAEIANLELLETRVHHEILVRKMKETNRQLKQMKGIISFLSGKGLKSLNESLGRTYDNSRVIFHNVDDTAYGFGEWYLSRVYGLFVEVLKLNEIRSVLERDLVSISNERKFVEDLISARHEDFLEYIVILLVIIEVIVEILYLIK